MRTVLNEWQLWCRLCGDKETDKHIDLFPTDDNNGVVLGDTKLVVSEVIEKHFALTITVDDYLPKMLCLQCYRFISTIVDINESIVKVQKIFNDMHAASMQLALEKQSSEISIIEKEGTLNNTLIPNDPETDIICSYCGEQFQYIRTYRAHIKKQHVNGDQNAMIYDCFICGDTSLTTGDFKKHLLTHESTKKKCNNDGISNDFQTPKELHICSQCNQYFSSKESLQSHIKSVHKNGEERNVRKSKVKKSQQKQFICEECGAVLRNKVNLTIHMQRHSDEAPYECEVCKKRFKNPRRLTIHSETHTSHKHICPICGLQLNAKNTLRRHRLVHSDERKHKCDYCGRGFKTSDGLKSHLMAHIGIKPYACNFCDRCFSCAVNCRLHKQSKHAKELTASEANGGSQQIVHKIPSLHTLRAIIKSASGGLNPVTKNKRIKNTSK